MFFTCPSFFPISLLTLDSATWKIKKRSGNLLCWSRKQWDVEKFISDRNVKKIRIIPFVNFWQVLIAFQCFLQLPICINFWWFACFITWFFLSSFKWPLHMPMHFTGTPFSLQHCSPGSFKTFMSLRDIISLRWMIVWIYQIMYCI